MEAGQQAVHVIQGPLTITEVELQGGVTVQGGLLALLTVPPRPGQGIR